MKIRYLFVLTLFIQLIFAPSYVSIGAAERESFPKLKEQIEYLALGDSLAAGVNFNGEIVRSYSDFLALELESIGVLHSFNKGFAMPGYTTMDVLTDINHNAAKEGNGIGVKKGDVQLREEIANADVITMSAGANDVLMHVQVDATTGELKLDEEKIKLAFLQVKEQYANIITQIFELNGDVQIFVMGYYNPFPYLPEELQPDLHTLLDQLNGSIVAGIDGSGAIFVETAGPISENYETYLPNPENIHLSEAGYQAVANQFYESLLKNNPVIRKKVFANMATDMAGKLLPDHLAMKGQALKALVNFLDLLYEN